MPLPANFSGMPQLELHPHFRKVCLEFKKCLKHSKDIAKLDQELDRFLNVSNEIKWPHKNSDVYHVDEGIKAISKVVKEYQRYKKSIQENSEKAIAQDVIEALQEVEALSRNLVAV